MISHVGIDLTRRDQLLRLSAIERDGRRKAPLLPNWRAVARFPASRRFGAPMAPGGDRYDRRVRIEFPDSLSDADRRGALRQGRLPKKRH